MATDEFTGPFDYLVFTFPDGADVGPGLTAVLAQVDAGTIEVLDLEIVRADAFGAPERLALSDVQVTGADLSAFAGAETDILDDEDLARIAGDLNPGEFALALVYEDRSLAAAASAWVAAGGSELYVGAAEVDELERILDALDEGTTR